MTHRILRDLALSFIGVVLLALSAASSAHAFERFSLGAHAGTGTESGATLGARVLWGRTSLLVLTADRSRAREELGLSRSQWDLGVDGIQRLRPGARLQPYLGAGMAFVRVSAKVETVSWGPRASDWLLGANLIGGAELGNRGRRFRPFAEIRGQLWGAEQVVVVAGLRY